MGKYTAVLLSAGGTLWHVTKTPDGIWREVPADPKVDVDLDKIVTTMRSTDLEFKSRWERIETSDKPSLSSELQQQAVDLGTYTTLTPHRPRATIALNVDIPSRT